MFLTAFIYDVARKGADEHSFLKVLGHNVKEHSGPRSKK